MNRRYGDNVIQFDKPMLDTFVAAKVRGGDRDLGGRFTRELAVLNGVMSYRMRNRGSVPIAPEDIISLQAVRREGGLIPSYNLDYYGTDISIIGNGQPHLYALSVMLSGAAEMIAGPNGTAVAHGSNGLILRGLPETRIRTTDNSARLVLWIESVRFDRALTAQLGEPPRQSLAFSANIDWSVGPPQSVFRLIRHLFDELRDPTGITTDAIARETFTDLLVHTALNRLQHNYTAQLNRPPAVAIPGHLRRAEAFMHAYADKPIALADIAAAAGCSLGNLQRAFRLYRDTTVLAALHDVRLRHIRAALLKAGHEEKTQTIARRFGFTNPSRFIAAYGNRFGERPSETRQRH